ncbi:MAG: helix-turn-helix transcriptional regulator [Prolixibacteraceae bacterium]|nr:helix-turn-helix transcriptional regulator [Prolixibacteraceae bacterium]
MMNKKEISEDNQLLLTSIAKRLEEMRKSKGIGYVDFAKEVGISKNVYYQIEQGKSNFQINTLMVILQHHEVSFIDFIQSLEK